MQEKIDYKKLNIQSAREVLGGKNIVFTGRGFLARGELMRLARQAGANVDSVVTKKCDILIVGEKPGSKLRKAKVLGINILRKNIILFINNEIIKERLIINIKLNGGSIVNNIDKNTDILIYQPSLKIDELLHTAKELNIEILTLGEFNRKLIINNFNI